MSKLVINRLQQSLLVVFGISVLVFFLIHLTGDPAATMLPPDTSPEVRAEFSESMGFNDPLIIQYFRFIKNAVLGDFGLSFRHHQPALNLVLERLPATLQLTAAALVLALLIAIPLGLITAAKRHSLYDYIGSIIAILGQSMPVFWLGLMLLLVFGVKFNIFPISGRDSWRSIVLPAVTLGCYTAASIMRLLRSGLIDVLNQDYIKTAKAKGVTGKAVLVKHALKNALLPVITVVGMQMGALMGGAVITETIFSWPGVGRLLVQAINNRDIPLVQAGVFVLAVSIVFINLLTDIGYTFLDPRIRSLRRG